MKKYTAKKYIDLHSSALAEFNKVEMSQREERELALVDRRFYVIPGAQWEGAAGKQFENRPKFEINKAHLAVIRIMNEYLANRISVYFKSRTGQGADALVDTCNFLHRADEQDSMSDEAYDNAFEGGIGGGMGAWRYHAEYEDESDPDNEYQRIRITPIYDAEACVFFDSGCKRADKRDAKRCWVLSSMPVDDFMDTYEEDPSSWPKSVDKTEFDWATPDVVYIAEFYQIEFKSETYLTYEWPHGKTERYLESEIEDDADLQRMLEATGAELIKSRKIKKKKVHKYLMSGNGILEDCGFVPGPNIPVVVTYGKRWIIDGIERFSGHTRTVKDCQQIKNLQVSKLGEISAYSSIEKPIFTPEQTAGHGKMWAEDNVKNLPFLHINLIEDPTGQNTIAGPLGYTKPPSVPPALAALLQLTEADMKELLGSPEQAETLQPNTSGWALELVQNKLDLQYFIYISNFAKALKRGAEIWLGMAKELYVEEDREMLGIDSRGEERKILLNQLKEDEAGKAIFDNDLTKADMRVVYDIGPSSANKRQSTVRNLATLAGATTDPETQMILHALILLNLDGEGLSETRGYFRKKLLKLGVLEPTKEEATKLAEEAAATPEDPNATYLRAAAQSELAKTELDQAKTVETLANAKESEAKTLQILSEVGKGPASSKPATAE